ncbi:hypothetical protein [Teichococcus vastitatis]|nr:hypothetical protein [Pseudoroseomonas vastitatis]
MDPLWYRFGWQLEIRCAASQVLAAAGELSRQSEQLTGEVKSFVSQVKAA